MGKPSGPGAFKSCMWNEVDLISSGDVVVRRFAFSSSVTQGRIKYSRWVGKWTSSSLNCCLKFSRKNCLMSLDLEIHEPSSVLIVSILFLLLWKMVERWKNFEFLALAKFPWIFVAIKSHFGIAILLVQIKERFRELHSPRKVVVIEPV